MMTMMMMLFQGQSLHIKYFWDRHKATNHYTEPQYLTGTDLIHFRIVKDKAERYKTGKLNTKSHHPIPNSTISLQILTLAKNHKF